MSRGLGRLQRRVLETLFDYRRHGESLEWVWRPSRWRYTLSQYAEEYVQDYERAELVPCWILLRDIGCSRSELSRALRRLARRRLVTRHVGDLCFRNEVGSQGTSTKFAKITERGIAWLKCQQSHSEKVDTYYAEKRRREWAWLAPYLAAQRRRQDDPPVEISA